MHVCRGEWNYFCTASRDLVCALTLSHVRNSVHLVSFSVQRTVDIILFDKLFSSLGFGLCPYLQSIYQNQWGKKVIIIPDLYISGE